MAEAAAADEDDDNDDDDGGGTAFRCFCTYPSVKHTDMFGSLLLRIGNVSGLDWMNFSIAVLLVKSESGRRDGHNFPLRKSFIIRENSTGHDAEEEVEESRK